LPSFDAAEALQTFLRARREGLFFPAEWEGSLTLDEAYRVLVAWERHLESEGQKRIGWKVGLTAKPIQDQFSVHEPVFGFLMDNSPYASGSAIPFDSLIKPGFENEICVTAGADLAGPGMTVKQARRGIQTIRPAFELIETRGDFIGHAEKVVPDNLQQKGIIIGDEEPFTEDMNLSEVALRVIVNGQTVDEGIGSAVLGDPVNSVVWLANRLAEFNLHISAGDLIMTGSFTRQHAISRGDAISASFAGLGEVTASFP
jgi:2-keto-4-pentenoate hydratase